MTGLCLEELSVGQSAELVRIVRADDLVAFAAVTGDDNPVHLNEDYAKTTRFGGRIAHGMLAGGYISAVIGARLPGAGVIYVLAKSAFSSACANRRRGNRPCNCHGSGSHSRTGDSVDRLPCGRRRGGVGRGRGHGSKTGRMNWP